MKQIKVSIAKQKVLIFVLILAILIAVAIRRIMHLAADPVGEKDCGPATQNGITGANQSRLHIEQLPANLPFEQVGGTINDASCLDRTAVFGVIRVQNEQDIRNALAYAQSHKRNVSIAGARHSMGGQAFVANGLVLDMTHFKQLSLNTQTGILTVQSGAIWKDVQNFLNPQGYAIKSMQGIDLLTIGGTIAANAHGIDHTVGSIASTIQSMRVMLADGTIHTVNRTQEPQLFNAVIGGYGLFGVVLDANIEITSNRVYQRAQTVTNYQSFPTIFAKQILPDAHFKLAYAHLSPDPKTFMQEMILYTYRQDDAAPISTTPLKEEPHVQLERFFFNYAKHGLYGQQIKWAIEKNLLPRFVGCDTTRNQAISQPEACFISRNQAMSGSQLFIKNNLPNDTDIFQEYFIPQDQFVPFVDGMRAILLQHKGRVMNASVRVVNKDDSMLNYAKDNMFSIVLYLNQGTSSDESAKTAQINQSLIDLATKLHGTFYLTYQLNYSQHQLRKAYPEIDAFFDLKKVYDPNELFKNKFYEAYS